MTLALVGDIGGTNARFAIADVAEDLPRVGAPRLFRVADQPDPSEAIEAVLADAPERPTVAVLAVAGPVGGGAVRLTNAGWSLSEAGLRAHGMDQAKLINDFAAQAWAAPLLDDGDRRSLGGPAAGATDATIATLGPGTGFGLAAWVDDGQRQAVVSGEGGHVGFAPVDDVEIEILRLLTRRYGRVSIERILSGPGLAALHEALSQIDGKACDPLGPDAVTRRALAGQADARRTVERFCAILGSVAGDAALALGARGGVYVAGGVGSAIADILARSDFRQRFEDKGRFAGYLRTVPTWLVTRDHPALLGAANCARTLHAP